MNMMMIMMTNNDYQWWAWGGPPVVGEVRGLLQGDDHDFYDDFDDDYDDDYDDKQWLPMMSMRRATSSRGGQRPLTRWSFWIDEFDDDYDDDYDDKQCFFESLDDIDEDLNPRYLPVTRQEGFDLRAHIETAGHQVNWNEWNITARTKDTYTAYLYDIGFLLSRTKWTEGTTNYWSRRWEQWYRVIFFTGTPLKNSKYKQVNLG